LTHPRFSPPSSDLDENFRSCAHESNESWKAVPRMFRASADDLPPPWEEIFGPLRTGKVDRLVVVGQVGQSLDGRVATTTGRSRYINGPAGLAHLHRLRSLVDAVVIGIGSALADDPQLTVRRVAGPDPVRVVIDPQGKIARTARVLADDGTRRIVVLGQGARCEIPGIEILALPTKDRNIAPAAILRGLAELGLCRVLVEGGPDTLSRFLAAGCLDRLHVVVAPIVLGDGRSGFSLGPIDRLDQALRPPTRVHPLDGDVLFDCDLTAQRVPAGHAKKSI
jgi:diaminohydroxyphosphoribosylaminopyrimidine deaminase / 5-amino-6-(5-phosphoribosylamino)uracil reductase